MACFAEVRCLFSITLKTSFAQLWSCISLSDHLRAVSGLGISCALSHCPTPEFSPASCIPHLKTSAVLADQYFCTLHHLVIGRRISSCAEELYKLMVVIHSHLVIRKNAITGKQVKTKLQTGQQKFRQSNQTSLRPCKLSTLPMAWY